MKRFVSATLLAAAVITVIATPAHAKPACAPEKNSETEAVALAKACKSRVEIAGRRTEKERYFANADGTQSFEITAVAQRVRKNGVWHDIDTKLQKGKDGRWAPKAAAEASFSDGGDDPFVMSIVDGRRFDLSWPGKLGKPKIDGATATYPDVLPDVDLAVTATGTGYSYVLVVKTAAAAASPALAKVSYLVSGELSVRNTADGSLELVDAAGKVMPAGSHASAMWDSSADPALGGEVQSSVKVDAAKIPNSTATEPGPAARVRQISARADGNSIVVTPDADLLKNGTLPLFIDPPLDRYISGWAYATSTNTNWTPGEHARVGRNPDDGKRFRSFFEFPMSGIQGVQITEAKMNINLDHSSACAGNTAYLYRANGIGGVSGSRVAWSHGIVGPLTSAWGQSNEAGGCGADQGDDLLVFGGAGFQNDVQYASDQSWGAYTIGLCMCTDTSGSNETGTYQWMKFHYGSAGTSTPTLSGKYNRPPGTPTELSTSDQACGLTVATFSPTLKARLVDPDGGEVWLDSTFEWKELPSGAVNSVVNAKAPPGNFVSTTLPLGGTSEGKSYSWRLNSTDGISPTHGISGWCDFTVNAGPPPLPAVSSPVYLADGIAHGGTGQSAQFTFDRGGDTGRDLTQYVYGWTDPPVNVVTVPAGGSATVTLTPPRHGYNILHVFSREPSLIASPTKHYQFLVGGPSAPVAHWPLDQINAPGTNNVIGSAHLTVESASNDVVWTPDLRLIGSNTLRLNGVTETPTAVSGSLTATGTGLNTSGSFSVAAWVRTESHSCDNADIVAIESGRNEGFGLEYDCWANRFRFAMPATDTDFFLTTYAPSTTIPKFGHWTHLTGVWDEAESKVKLYVNGVLEANVTPSASWLTARGSGFAAAGPVTVGRTRIMGGPTWYFNGSVADLRLWNRAVVGDDLLGTNADVAAGTLAVPGILKPIEVGSWNFADNDILDGGYWSRHMSPSGTAWFASPGRDGNDSLLLDGAAGWAQTSSTVVRTDEALTISAWVKADQLSNVNQVMVRQNQVVNLYLDGAVDKWVFSVATPNGSGGYNWTGSTGNATAATNAWVHLVGVFDPQTGQTRLYVNGQKQTSVGSNASGYYTSSPVEVGARAGVADFFDGEIDQVKIFSGAMNDREVLNLYNAG